MKNVRIILFVALVVTGTVVIIVMGLMKRERSPVSTGSPLGQLNGFRITQVSYFDGNTWMVAKITPTTTATDPATVVAERQGSTYKIKAGPGTQFSITTLRGEPNDVIQYLNSQGLVTLSSGDSDD